MLVYGATYFISEVPSPEFWEKDLEEIRKRGMNTVKILAVWEDVEPEESKYRLENHKALLGLCQKVGLDVLLEIRHKNRGFPRWFTKNYPESMMVTAEGYKKLDSACYNNPFYRRSSGRFVKNVVKEFKAYQCLKYWDIWNEPHLNSSGDHFYELNKMVCYCEDCQDGYRKWRAQQQTFNKQTTGDGWQGIDIPVLSRFTRDHRDRLYFMQEVMVNEAKRLYDLVREEDNRPIALHDVFISPVFPAVALGNDDWELANTVDIYGTSCSGPASTGEEGGENFYWFTPMVLDETRSAANGKPWWNSEWHVAGRILPLSANRNRTFETIKKEYFEMLTRGTTGLITWAYRTYSNTFCLVDIYDRTTGTFDHMTQITRRLKEINHFEQREIRKPEVAIVYDPTNQLKIWEETGDSKILHHATESIYKYLYDSNAMIDFIHGLTAGKASQYKAIVIPAPLGLSENMLEALKKYVAQGGVIVSEGCFSYLDGYASSIQGVPAHGFDKIFGIKIADMSPPAPSGKDSALIFKDRDGREFPAVYRHHYELVKTTGAKVLLESETGAKVTLNEYGKGKAIYISGLLFPPTNYSRDEFYNTLAVAGELIVKERDKKNCKLTNNYSILDYVFETLGMKGSLPLAVRRDIFGSLIVYHNNNDAEQMVKEEKDCYDIFSTAKYQSKRDIPLAPGETKVLFRE